MVLGKRSGRLASRRMKPAKYIGKHIWNDRIAYLMLLPVLANFIIFHYLPMWGIKIAFVNYNIALPIEQSPWVGLANFIRFFKSYYFWQVTGNTVIAGLYSIIFGFPAPILLALLVNEIRNRYFKKTLQTISYMPFFVSTVIVVGLVFMLLNPADGIINMLIKNITGNTIPFTNSPKWFRTEYIILGLWQGTGFGSIIYLAAISGIDPELYEAAIIDGAGRLRRMWSITIMSLLPTIAILFILRLGGILGVDFFAALLLQNPSNILTSEVIQTLVYKQGIVQSNYSYATAVGLVLSLIGLLAIIGSNAAVKRITHSEMSLF